MRKQLGTIFAALILVVSGALIGGSGAFIYLAGAPAPVPERTFGPTGTTGTATAEGTPTSTAVRPGAAPAPELGPNMLSIPSLAATAPLDLLGVADGELILPEPTRLTLYRNGSYPGDARGTVLVAGHVNSYTLGRGTLFFLVDVKEGASIWVTDAAGRPYEYRVESLQLLQKQALPQTIFGREGDPRLVVVTCGGEVVATAQGRHYADNVIVTAIPVTSGVA